jgi:hypothetical protein
VGASYNKNECSLFGNEAAQKTKNGDYGSECQVAIPTCEDEELYEFENVDEEPDHVADGPKNKINGLRVKKRRGDDVKLKTKPVVENISDNNPMKSDPSVIESGFTYNQSQFAKNLSSLQGLGSNVESSNQAMSLVFNTKVSQPKFRMSTDGSNLIVPKNYSIGAGSLQRMSQEAFLQHGIQSQLFA